MKHILTTGLAAITLLTLAVGCTSLQDKENLAVAAGFKAITPSKPSQVERLKSLPADKVTRITHKGQTYYVLPDVANNVAYVGGPQQYQSYQQLRLARQMSNQNLEAAEMNDDASMNMNWGAWGGWGAWAPMGWY
ncbi:MAG: hypothetical protein WCH98_17465 [Verrucomicrobiota bacterium]